MRRRPLRRFPLAALGALAALLAAAPLAADSISYSADSQSTVMASGKERTILEGHARVVMGKMTIDADRIELYGKDNRWALCTGSVVVEDPKRGIRATTARMDYDRDLKLSRFQGPTVLEDKENAVVLKGSWVENDENTEIVTIQIGVRILKDDMVCRSEYAIYRRSQDSLELTGLPVVVKGTDEYRAARIVINTKTNEISLEGKVSGTITQSGASPSPAASGSPLPAGSPVQPGSPSGTDQATPAPGPSPAPSASPSPSPSTKAATPGKAP